MKIGHYWDQFRKVHLLPLSFYKNGAAYAIYTRGDNVLFADGVRKLSEFKIIF